jgi:hypothetical protein
LLAKAAGLSGGSFPSKIQFSGGTVYLEAVGGSFIAIGGGVAPRHIATDPDADAWSVVDGYLYTQRTSGSTSTLYRVASSATNGAFEKVADGGALPWVEIAGAMYGRSASNVFGIDPVTFEGKALVPGSCDAPTTDGQVIYCARAGFTAQSSFRELYRITPPSSDVELVLADSSDATEVAGGQVAIRAGEKHVCVQWEVTTDASESRCYAPGLWDGYWALKGWTPQSGFATSFPALLDDPLYFYDTWHLGKDCHGILRAPVTADTKPQVLWAQPSLGLTFATNVLGTDDAYVYFTRARAGSPVVELYRILK